LSHSDCLKKIVLLIAIIALMTGCVRRRLIVRSNPPGASVYVDKQLIGTTPASTSFTYYGTREIEVVADGFRTEKVLRTISPPWYQVPPIDFVSETLWPWELRDERIIDITMTPNQPLASEVLQSRADSLRLQAAQGIATPVTEPVPPVAEVFPPPEATTPPAPPHHKRHFWNPIQALHNFFAPGGEPPQSIPEAGILQGGGYRPEI
jgi:hypothetical protein